MIPASEGRFPVVHFSLGVKDWAEIIGIMTEKDSQGDEEILIYAMTLLNKVQILLLLASQNS